MELSLFAQKLHLWSQYPNVSLTKGRMETVAYIKVCNFLEIFYHTKAQIKCPGDRKL